MSESMAERLKRLRMAKGFKVEEFAQKLNVPVTTYRDWEKGRSIQGQPYIEIAKVLEVPLGSVLGVPELVSPALRKRWLIGELEELLKSNEL